MLTPVMDANASASKVVADASVVFDVGTLRLATPFLM
jgi:hypothetical protein